MNLRRRHFMRLAAATALLPTAARIAAAQTWPARSIRAFVTAGPGSAVDVVPRVVFDQLAIQLGQPIVVENRAGAGGTIAVTMVARAPPDGYTILAASSALTVAPWLHPSLPYDTSRDLAAIAALGSIPNVLVTSPLNGSKTIAQFIAAAKAKPGSFNYTSTGVGTATHMSAERFRVSAGIEAVHVPTKSGPEALTEVLSGRADFYLCPMATAPAVHTRRQSAGLGSQRRKALAGVARRSDHLGGGSRRRGLHLLARPVRTPTDGARHHRAAAR
jgi:tripartite-type tricarboxylate transporter receptor subunit TctC